MQKYFDLKTSIRVKTFYKTRIFFFLNSIIDFDEQLTTMFKTKRKKYYKNIIIKVCINKVTTKLQ